MSVASVPRVAFTRWFCLRVQFREKFGNQRFNEWIKVLGMPNANEKRPSCQGEHRQSCSENAETQHDGSGCSTCRDKHGAHVLQLFSIGFSAPILDMASEVCYSIGEGRRPRWIPVFPIFLNPRMRRPPSLRNHVMHD